MTESRYKTPPKKRLENARGTTWYSKRKADERPTKRSESKRWEVMRHMRWDDEGTDTRGEQGMCVCRKETQADDERER